MAVDITFENSGEKSKGAVVWNVRADGVFIGTMYKEYASGDRFLNRGGYYWTADLDGEAQEAVGGRGFYPFYQAHETAAELKDDLRRVLTNGGDTDSRKLEEYITRKNDRLIESSRSCVHSSGTLGTTERTWRLKDSSTGSKRRWTAWRSFGHEEQEREWWNWQTRRI